MTTGITIGPRRSPCAHELEPTPGGRTPSDPILTGVGVMPLVSPKIIIFTTVGVRDALGISENYYL